MTIDEDLVQKKENDEDKYVNYNDLPKNKKGQE
jgi:hypothetical protein